MILQAGDLINGLFECVGGLLVWLNVIKLLRDKQVRGSIWYLSAFFWAWGVFNMWFYPSLHLWLSFIGGLVISTGNTYWIWLAWKYRKN